MNAHSSHNKSAIPLSVVLITVGFLILFTVAAIWVLAPAKMPRAFVTAVEPYLPDRLHLPTPAAVAVLPDTNTLLPESPSETELSSPISANDTIRRGPRAGEPARILIPQIGVDAAVRTVGVIAIESNGKTYYQWRVPHEYKAGWHQNSARLGEPGNTVLNGHHNVYGEVFRDLVDLEEGDQIMMYDATNTLYKYQITEKEILPERGESLSVRLENARWIEPTEDERITLVTCWPYEDNSHRLIVVAEPVTEPEA
jgi:sortase A